MEALVEELFQHASPRPQPPPADAEFVRQALYKEWDQVVSQRRVRRRMGWFAAAASILVMAGAATIVLRPQMLFPRQAVVATIERAVGTFQVAEAGQQSTPAVAEGFELLEGHTLITGADALVAMRPASGGSLRLAAGSTLKLLDEGRVELTGGALYFDSWSGGDQPGGHLIVDTPMGTVRDVGTQFVTRMSPDSLAVSVREGLVAVHRGDDELVATVGEHVTVGESRHVVERHR